VTASSGEQVLIRYEGTPNVVGALAHCLEEQGLSVDYDPPLEKRGVGPVDVVALVLDRHDDASTEA
jgi:hypothetical protein